MNSRISTITLTGKLILLLFSATVAGLFFSRALLSITMGLWVFAFLLHGKFRSVVFSKEIFRWYCIAPLLVLLGCWQDPLASSNLQFLFTMMAYPACLLAMIVIAYIEKKQTGLVRILILIWVLCAILSLIYPLGWYLLHIREAHEIYGTGRTLPVFMDNDHVRYSLFLNAALLLAWQNHKEYRWFPAACMILGIAIVLLAVRTGWVALLVIIIVQLIEYGKREGVAKALKWVGLLVVIVALSLSLFPTVQQKVRYMVYDWQQAGNTNRHLSDGTRLAMNKSALLAIEEGNTNNGWANVPIALQASFKKIYPERTIGFGWPFNQWLLWWMGSGLAGMIILSGWLFFPLYIGFRKKNTGLISLTLVIATSCLVEATLGYQFGVWLHAWPLAFMWAFNNDQRRALTSRSDNS